MSSSIVYRAQLTSRTSLSHAKLMTLQSTVPSMAFESWNATEFNQAPLSIKPLLSAEKGKQILTLCPRMLLAKLLSHKQVVMSSVN